MLARILAGQARQALSVIGGMIVAKGYIDEGTMTQVIGALVALIPFALSAFSKLRHKEAP